MSYSTRLKLFLVWVLTLVLAVSCAVNPVTGKRELMLISEEGEISLGKETDTSIRNQYGLYDDSALTNYITQMGMEMVPHTHRPNLTYHFYILDTPVINAFAVPGGYIYVTRGVMAMMGSEAELAVVLGHELGHVNARHSVRKMSQVILVQLGLAVGSALSDTFAKISGVASIGIQLLFLKFSRDDERQADSLGIEYARKGKYNPSKMVRFFDSLQKMGDLSGGHSLPGFLSTHPLNSERIRNTKAMLQENDARLRIGESDFLNRLNNLVYGQDPRQGYLEKGRFYHPLLRFSFTVPSGWKVQNTPSQVTMATQDGNAAVILQAEKYDSDLKSYAAKRASGNTGWTMLSDQITWINGLSAYHQVYEISQENQEALAAKISYIRKGSYVYSFSALCLSKNYSQYDGTFNGIIGSFSQLSDSRYLNRKPKRIRLTRADGRKTLKNIFQNSGIPKDLWPRFAVMNGMDINEKPKKGKVIKVIR